MKKKVLAAVLSLSMILSTGVVAMADETKDPSEVKVGVITDVGGVNDGSFNQSAWEGLTRANEELGITTNYLESHTDSDYIPNLETFIDEEYDLIICIGSSWLMRCVKRQRQIRIRNSPLLMMQPVQIWTTLPA